MRRRPIWILTGVIALGAAAGLAFWLRSTGSQPEDVIEASGQVRGTEITVSSKLAGTVEKLPIREGLAVGQKELLARISSKEIEARLERATSDAGTASNRLKEVTASIKSIDTSIEQAEKQVQLTAEGSFHSVHEAKAMLEHAEAQVREAESAWTLAQSEFERSAKLAKDAVIPVQELDRARARFKTAEAALDSARNAREAARAGLQRAEAGNLEVEIRRKEVQRLRDEKDKLKATYEVALTQQSAAAAAVKEVAAHLEDTFIYAPVRGTIINKLVEAGELVNPGTPIATVVDLLDLYVRVYIAEKDIGKIRLGNRTGIRTDAFPDRSFEGQVSEISERAEYTPKEFHLKDERTKLAFGVKIQIANPEGYLKPGMPVDVQIRWRENAP